MGNLTINNGGIVTNSTNVPNIDLRYGPYENISEAYRMLGSTITPGLTVGLIEDGEIKEYIVNDDYQLTPKLKLKTINNQPITGEGNITIQEGGDYTELTNIPNISDNNTEVPLQGTLQVSAETTTGVNAEVTLDTSISGKIKMKFTLPKGADGQNGAPGNNGHNPNLGTYLDTDTLPTTGQSGDYIYVVDTSVTPRTANVYAWNGTAFADTGKSVEDFGLQFASGQTVPGTGIKDLNGNDDPTAAGVLSAEAGKELNKNLYGENVDETAVASVAQSGCFRKASTGNAWINSGGATSVRMAIPSRALKVRFTVPVHSTSTRKGQATFTKKQLPSTGKTYQALVDEGYLCDDTTGYNDILKEFAGGSTNTVDVPKGAAFIYFVNKDYDNAYTHPYPASITPITHIDGDVDTLIKGNEKAASLEGRVDALEASVDVSYRASSVEYTTIPDSYVNGGTGDIGASTAGNAVAVLDVTGLQKVAFLAVQLSSYTGSSGYVFVDGEDNKIDYAKYAINLDAATRGNYECVLDVPEGAVSLKCTVSAANIPLFYVKRIDGDTVTEYVDCSNPMVNVVSGDDVTKLTYHKNTSSADMNQGVLEPNGNVTSVSYAYYTKDIIEVEPGDVITAHVYYVNSGEEVPNTNMKAIQSVCCYKNGVVVPGGYSSFSTATPNSTRTNKYVVPYGCNGVKITIEHDSVTYPYAKILIHKNGGKVVYVKVVNNDDYDQRMTIESMDAGVKYELPYADVWSNKVIALSAKVTRDAENGIGTLTIGNTRLSSAIWGSNPASIAINDSTITTVSGNGVSQNGSWSHGLTIDKDIQVIVETDRGEHQLVKITLRSNGQEYVISGNDFIQPYNDTQVRKTWGQVSGARYAQASLGGVFSEVSFANIFKDLLAPVWIFGDSYCSNNGPQRWVRWAETAGVTNFLLSSFAGATSKDQINSFRSLIAIRRPKIVAWFLGMNDADSLTSTQSTNPNADWLECVKEVCETCDKYGVVVVLATIPSVKYTNNTIRSNEAKSNWVVASGRRYFDERAAVGDDGTGEWIDGYEEWNTVDGVLTRGDHTSTAGAKALFARLLADVPEIMFKN